MLVCANAPPAVMPEKFKGLPPKLAAVIVCAGLVVPTFCENVKDAGVKLIADGTGLGSGTGVTPNT